MSQVISTPARPSTPTNLPKAAVPSTPVTGSWKHPRLNEIINRQNASTFSERNIKTVFWNLGGAAVVWFIGRALWHNLPSLFLPGKVLQPYATWIYYSLVILFIYNISVACVPLIRVQDDMEDIPLTPAQRKLLGLPPSSKAATPDATYSTPPRYKRTPTTNNSPGSKGSLPNSPLSGKGKQSPLGDSMGSKFSLAASPLLQKATGGVRRHSYGSPSPLGPGNSRFGVPEMPGSPSPSAAKIPSVGLNSKWLYDKERRNSGSARLYT